MCTFSNFHNYLIAACQAVLLLVVAPRAFGAGAAALDVREVASGVFVHQGMHIALDARGHDDIADIGFIVGTRCVAVIDTGGSVRIGRALRESVRRVSRLPVCYVLNTHVHVDHVLGNAAFLADHPHFVGHAALAAALARSRDFFLNEYAGDLDAPPSATQIVAPDTTVTTTLMLDLGGRSLQLRAWPTAHTDCDLTVFDNKTATLFSGDLLFRERLPVFDGSVRGSIAALGELAKIPTRLVVPGHGAPTRDPGAAIARERAYFQALVDGVRDALAHGQSMQWAIEHVASEQKTDWLLWDSAHSRNVARAYEELEWE